MTPRALSLFRELIWQYYMENGRVFPWRQTHNPYHILVSEIMLQQTQTARVLAKYDEFIEAFPDLPALAHAPLTSVLRVWQGLGYNRRAIALQRIARRVLADFGGELPSSPEILRGFPAIGPHTASAIAALAFNQPAAFIETNIRAVFLHFFFDERTEVRDREILPLVEVTVDTANPREWYYALYDYGAMLKKTRKLNAQSAHYRRQGRFEGSNRQVRGRILRILLDSSPIPEHELITLLDVDAAQVRVNLERLQEEGFLSKKGDTICTL